MGRQSPAREFDLVETSSWQKLHQFWFGSNEAEKTDLKGRFKLWFSKNATTDDFLREQFAPWLDKFEAHQLIDWQATCQGLVSLIVLLDQIPRNCFRRSPRSFAYDEAARLLVHQELGKNRDQEMSPLEKIFFYLPLEHSENIEDQNLSVQLYKNLAENGPEELKQTLQSTLEYAIRHQEIVSRFGRFPHRNQALSRPSTPAEVEFLKTPGSSF